MIRTVLNPALRYTASPKRPLALRFLDWLVAADAGYRERQTMRELPPERLNDMGLPVRFPDLVARKDSGHGW